MTRVRQPVTLQLLNDAPLGSWLVEELEWSRRIHSKSIFRKVPAEGFFADLPDSPARWKTRGGRYSFSSESIMAAAGAARPPKWTLHHPGMVKVMGKVVMPGVLAWGWECRIDGCEDGSEYFFDADNLHDSARLHVANHIEIGLAS